MNQYVSQACNALFALAPRSTMPRDGGSRRADPLSGATKESDMSTYRASHASIPKGGSSPGSVSRVTYFALVHA